MADMDKETLKKLKEELPGVFAAVGSYAVSVCRTKPWFNANNATIRDAAHDLALDAVHRTLEGDRVWDPAGGPLDVHLKGVVDSLASNRATAADTKAMRFALPDAETDRTSEASVPKPSTPMDFYLDREACDAIEADAFDAAGEDPILSKLVTAVVDGHFDVSEICKAAGMTPKEVYAAKKKLKARIKTLISRRHGS